MEVVFIQNVFQGTTKFLNYEHSGLFYKLIKDLCSNIKRKQAKKGEALA